MIRIGLVDSGVGTDQAGHVRAARSFTGRPLAPDPFGHGSRVARIVLAHQPSAVLLNAQAFERGPGSAEAVAEAIRWLIEEGARMVNLSLGLRHDRRILRAAVEDAARAGLVLLASAPVRGPMSYPAAYPGVIRITGDARCAASELSALGGEPADYGACVLGPDGEPGGASFATAHASGLLGRGLAAGAAAKDVLEALVAHRGRERRG